MEVQELIPVEYQGVRCLTGKQIAELFGTTPKRIKDNFRSAKKYFIEGEHYFKVGGEDLRDLKAEFLDKMTCYVPDPLKDVCREVNLYTAAGIFIHAKMLSTPKAWALFSRIGAAVIPSLLEEIIFGVANAKVDEEKAHVYVTEMSDETVKIGVAANFERRKKQIQYETKLNIIRSYCTDALPRARAFLLEGIAHGHFIKQIVHGEFFNVKFEEAILGVEKILERISKPPQRD
jgi:hypothetical protein